MKEKLAKLIERYENELSQIEADPEWSEYNAGQEFQLKEVIGDLKFLLDFA